MKKLLLVLSVPALITSMQLPVAREPLSPRSREMAQQRAVINANRVEQQAFQEESTSAIIDLESDVWVLQRQVERLHAESATYTPQISAALGSANNQARLSSLHEQQIGTLERTQQLQAQLHAQHVMNLKTKLEKDNADLMQRIAAVEKSNYYLKWALGVSTAVTTTVFSIMGYLLWKNQQKIYEQSKIIVDKDHKGNIVRFGQNRPNAPQIAIPQPQSNQVSQSTAKPAAAAQQNAQPVIATPVQAEANPAQPLPQYATVQQLEELRGQIPQLARVMDKNGNIFLEYTDPGQQPRSGHSSYVGEFWPPKGFNERLK